MSEQGLLIPDEWGDEVVEVPLPKAQRRCPSCSASARLVFDAVRFRTWRCSRGHIHHTCRWPVAVGSRRTCDHELGAELPFACPGCSSILNMAAAPRRGAA